ncbi:kelch-like protein 10 [Nematostella vectensis]|uniref:kelch-like protein 10 n=1 Tax=Nematostella vectensis TaxID=45351 RepID=UPI00207706C0|nr:kelch-like protein 10 [Nematostella vectensis]
MADSSVNTTGQGSDDVKLKVQHPFSEPWDESDVILVVEEQEFHVHKFILKMASPVFKAMFEHVKDSKPIQLPGKKFNQVLDLMNHIYPTSNNSSITMDNVEHLSALAAEYQIKAVTNSCFDYLKGLEMGVDNISLIIHLLLTYHSERHEEIESQVSKAFNEMSLTDIKNLPKAKEIMIIANPLVKRMEKLEDWVRYVLPRIIDMMGMYRLDQKEFEKHGSVGGRCYYSNRLDGYDRARHVLITCDECRNNMSAHPGVSRCLKKYGNTSLLRRMEDIVEYIR